MVTTLIVPSAAIEVLTEDWEMEGRERAARRLRHRRTRWLPGAAQGRVREAVNAALDLLDSRQGARGGEKDGAGTSTSG
jgi:hypothetical protein